MVKIVIDSSVFIDHIRADKGNLRELLSLAKSEKAKLYIPTIVITELWRGYSMDKIEVHDSVVKMLRNIKVIELTKQLAKESGKLLRKGKVLDIEDAVIAATTMYLDAELATSNIKHFKKVKGLKIFKAKK